MLQTAENCSCWFITCRYKEAATDFLKLNPDSKVGSPGFHQVLSSFFRHGSISLTLYSQGIEHWSCLAPSWETEGQSNVFLSTQDFFHVGLGRQFPVRQQGLRGGPGVGDFAQLETSRAFSSPSLQLQLPAASSKLPQRPRSQVDSILSLRWRNPDTSQALDSRQLIFLKAEKNLSKILWLKQSLTTCCNSVYDFLLLQYSQEVWAEKAKPQIHILSSQHDNKVCYHFFWSLIAMMLIL